MNVSSLQSEAVFQMVLAIIASGRWPDPRDLRRCLDISEELLGLGCLLEVGAETAGELVDAERWRAKRGPKASPRVSGRDLGR